MYHPHLPQQPIRLARYRKRERLHPTGGTGINAMQVKRTEISAFDHTQTGGRVHFLELLPGIEDVLFDIRGIKKPLKCSLDSPQIWDRCHKHPPGAEHSR
jgi:hypothetical protein